MILSNTNFSVLYVDRTAGSSGDGSTPATALNSLPSTAAEMTSGTCYIIRRTSASYQVTLPTGGADGIAAIAFVGMPKSTDEFYDFMPSEAKTAWGSDAADYANIVANTNTDPYGGESSYCMRLPNCLVFFLYRVYLFRDSRGAYEYAVNLSSSAGTGTVSIERCKFGLKGADIESSSYTTAPSYGTGSFIQAASPLVFSLRKCVVNMIEDSSGYGGMGGSSYGAFYARSPKFFDVSDIDLWMTTGSVSWDEYSSYSSPSIKTGYNDPYSDDPYSGNSYCGNCNVCNLRVHYVQNGSNGGLPPALYAMGNKFVSFRSISVSMESRQLGRGTPSVISPSGTIIDCKSAPEFIFENITVNLPKVWKISSYNVVKLCASSSSTVPGFAKKVENISITLGTTSGVDTSGGGNYYSSYSSTEHSNWASNAALCLKFGNSSYGEFDYGSSSHEFVVARNISVTHPRGIALYAAYCYVKSCTLQGLLRAYAATCDITSITTWYPGRAIAALYGSTVKVGTLTLGKGNIPASDTDPAILGNPQESSSFVFVGTSNGSLMSNTRGSSTSYDNSYAVICANEVDTGHYTIRTENMVCDTWGVVRQGSTKTASLKLYNNTAAGPGHMSLGMQPFAGFSVPMQSGSHVLRIYVACKGMSSTNELARSVLAQVSVPQSSGVDDILFSCTSGRWSPDESVWIGESGLTAFLLEMPVQAPSACSVDVKIHFNWYSASGYLYVDPDIAIS